MIREDTDLVQVIGPFRDAATALQVREAYRGAGATVSPLASAED